MTRTHLLPLLLALLVATPAAHATIDLIAIGSVSGNYEDFATQTAGPLENGLAGNRLGGLGSGLAYAGGNTFIALPDRGPNAKPYNSAVDDTVSYITRFQTFSLSLAPSEPGAALPFTLTPFLTATTLLSSETPLFYGTGAGVGLDSGEPTLNATNHAYYFTGRSDNFDPTQLSTNPHNARFDPEGARVANDGKMVRQPGHIRLHNFGLYVERGLWRQTVQVLIDDDAVRIEQADHLLVSYPCVYDTRERRITAVDEHGRQQYHQVQAMQLVLLTLGLVRSVWRMPLYRRMQRPQWALTTLQMSLFDRFTQ